MVLFPDLDERTFEELTKAFDEEGTIADSEEVELRLQEIAARLAQTGEKGLSFLLDRLSSKYDNRVRAALLGLSLTSQTARGPRREELRRICLSYLNSNNPMLVADTVDCLCHHQFSDLMPLITPLLQHPSPYVVGSVLRYLRRIDPTSAVPVLISALNSPSANCSSKRNR